MNKDFSKKKKVMFGTDRFYDKVIDEFDTKKRKNSIDLQINYINSSFVDSIFSCNQ